MYEVQIIIRIFFLLLNPTFQNFPNVQITSKFNPNFNMVENDRKRALRTGGSARIFKWSQTSDTILYDIILRSFLFYEKKGYSFFIYDYIRRIIKGGWNLVEREKLEGKMR